MGGKPFEESQDQRVKNIITLLKIDVKNLMYRIEKRKRDYLNEFSLKRTREHFRDIFKSRYDTVSIGDLKELGQETIVSLDQFYQEVDELHWYVKHTQDMAQMMSDKVDAYIRSIKAKYDMLDIYLEADQQIFEEKADDRPTDSSSEDEYKDFGTPIMEENPMDILDEFQEHDSGEKN